MAAPFWKNGIRFECQETGRCCTSRGEYGYIYLTLGDRRRLAAQLGLPTERFTRLYCEKTDGHFHLKHPDRDCRFLDGRRCTVYESRPEQCRTWPFWPENMKPRVWRDEIVSFCPGIGKGRLYTADEIAGLLERDALRAVAPPSRRRLDGDQ
jgi:Fe-S-cluster containining protein